MSFTGTPSKRDSPSFPKVTARALRDRKWAAQPITAVTAFDFPSAKLVDDAGIDMVLVGDSLAMTVLGHENTLSLSMEEMLHHARAARRGVHAALFAVDMPFGSYHCGVDKAVENAVRFVKEAGAEAVKLEGGRARASLVERLTLEEIPVIAHIGLTPQSLHRMGGYTVQGKSLPAIEALMADAIAMEGAGAEAIVLEGIPREVASQITKMLSIPTIGIGAGPECDGQILVFHDLFGLSFSAPAKFVRRFANAEEIMRKGIENYKQAVSNRSFPDDSESYHLSAEVKDALAAIREHAGASR